MREVKRDPAYSTKLLNQSLQKALQDPYAKEGISFSLRQIVKSVSVFLRNDQNTMCLGNKIPKPRLYVLHSSLCLSI